MAEYKIVRDVLVHASREDLWDFISNPENLEKFTPKNLGGRLVEKDDYDRIVEGMKATYIMKPFKLLPVKWTAQFTEVLDNEYYIDTQIRGPFRKWEHKHSIISHNKSIFLRDELHYSPPFGFWGELANRMFLQKRLNEVFSYREKVLLEMFPEPIETPIEKFPERSYGI